MAKHKDDDERYATLAMKITSERSLWMMRAFALNRILERLGVDADWVFGASKDELDKFLSEVRTA